MKNKLLIVGTIAYDAIETPFGKVDKILGGAATYIGLSAYQFSLDSAVISVVGEDFDMRHIQLLKDKKIDVSGVEIVKGQETFFWSGKYHKDLNTRTTLETRLNVLENFNPIIPDAPVIPIAFTFIYCYKVFLNIKTHPLISPYYILNLK